MTSLLRPEGSRFPRRIPFNQAVLFRWQRGGRGDARDAALRLAGKDRDTNLLQAYLDHYPDGPHAADVRSLLSGAGKAPATTAQSQADVETVLWAVARNQRQRSRRNLSRALSERRACRGRKALIASLHERSRSSSPEFAGERLVTHPDDATASMNGVEMEDLKKNAETAVKFCRQATAAHPEVAHYQALLARATFAAGGYKEASRSTATPRTPTTHGPWSA